MEDEDRETLLDMLQKYPHLQELFSLGVDKQLDEIETQLSIMTEKCDDVDKLEKIDEMKNRVEILRKRQRIYKLIKGYSNE